MRNWIGTSGFVGRPSRHQEQNWGAVEQDGVLPTLVPNLSGWDGSTHGKCGLLGVCSPGCNLYAAAPGEQIIVVKVAMEVTIQYNNGLPKY